MMQDEESDKNTNKGQIESAQDEIEHNDELEAVEIEDNSNDNKLQDEIEVMEQALTKTGKGDLKKLKTAIKLPNEFELSGPSCNTDVTGDDVSKVEKQEISCECEQPTGTGGAVPVVLSLDLECPGQQSLKGISSDEPVKGYDDKSSTLSVEIRSDKESAENETLIREITSENTSSVIITPPPKQSTISNDSIFEINCNTSSENSTRVPETQQFAAADSSFVIEYAVSYLNAKVSSTNINLASLESLAKNESLSSGSNLVESKLKNDLVTPTGSRNTSVKIRKAAPNKVNPDLSGSTLVRPATALALKRELKDSANLLSYRNGVLRNTLRPKDNLPPIKKTVDIPTPNRGYKNAHSSDSVRPYTSSSSYGGCLKKGISSTAQSAEDKISRRNGEGTLKRPSMIPKPRTPTPNAPKGPPSSKIDLQRKDKPSDYNLVPKIEPGRRTGNASETGKRRTVENETAKQNEELSKSSQSVSGTPDAMTIHEKMVGLQERLKATTTMIRKRMGMNSIALPALTDNGNIIKDDPTLRPKRSSEPALPKTASATLKDLYKNIFEMKAATMRLSDATTMVSQKEHIEKLLMNITEIQRIADRMLDSEGSASQLNEPGAKDATIKSNKSKENKICIKFTQLKDKQRRKEDEASNQSDDGCKSSPGTTTDLEVSAIENVKTEASLKETDSMDGIFIPSQEPFIHNIEEEDESNGLDITITFPELNNLLSDQNESHLSVCLSDISAEALRQLKRCPKDFTLRMDFIQGKVHFQSGKSPANNFSIGPDLKFIENPVDNVDDKKSDIISIKPSTECSYGSQLISVENRDEHVTSYKSLKSTDSELFNVADLPFLYRDVTLGTVTRSCMTLRNDPMMSMSIVARTFFKSMPQIPSLTYIQEANQLENGSRLAEI
ncbi:unnamed protein product [Acanthoscelides obtectus]|uniref:Uncharacterized protein n=1 Tax=Acanthoscelides obtectus TaxID=200917 RepID=A0A9P0K6S0_ACAOB|nr:unnamed protein product [Acanthoscelides obtectus]CAK1683091.1 hypothetical protein AOBTE_LOCUS34073 [Acanthoscelides obtectus]